MGALGFLPVVPAHASTTSDRIAGTSRAVDAAAQRWFAAQVDAARIDATIADVERRIVLAEANLAHTREIATERIVVLYENGSGLSSIFGDNALDSARRAHLVENANAGGDAKIAQLTAAVHDLNAQRRALDAARAEQRSTLSTVATERAALDAELAAVRAQARNEAKVALAAARDQSARDRAAARMRALAAVQSANTLSPPTGPPTIAASVSVVVAAVPNHGRVSRHHADPFLVCTRMRESGGRYDAVSPSGYYGAYQFLPSTWDSTAIHAGRRDLVGLLPSRATPFDQDETAWALYQWQGTAPWGGRC
jgi:hypothetical protein